MHFQDIIFALGSYWAEQGCAIQQPYDMEVGAGTFHPATLLRALGPEPWRAAYPQPSRRPTDGRYGNNPNRLQHYYQYQVVMKPSPADVQELYLNSLKRFGLDLLDHDIRFVEDDWESPTLGASGLGWEVWLDGMEITQFTYFQHAGSIELYPTTVEITYGLERIAMYLQGVESVYDISWNGQITYGEIFHQAEVEFSTFNFEHADVEKLLDFFNTFEAEGLKLAELGLIRYGPSAVEKSGRIELPSPLLKESLNIRSARPLPLQQGAAKEADQYLSPGRDAAGRSQRSRHQRR